MIRPPLAESCHSLLYPFGKAVVTMDPTRPPAILRILCRRVEIACAAILSPMHSTVSSSIQIDRCDPAAEKEVLAVAAQAWPEAERAAYWQAIAALVRGGHSDRVVLLAARAGDRLLAVQI